MNNQTNKYHFHRCLSRRVWDDVQQANVRRTTFHRGSAIARRDILVKHAGTKGETKYVKKIIAGTRLQKSSAVLSQAMIIRVLNGYEISQES